MIHRPSWSSQRIDFVEIPISSTPHHEYQDTIAPSSPPYNFEETKKYSPLAGTLVVCFRFQSQKQIKTYQPELYHHHHHRSHHRSIVLSIIDRTIIDRTIASIVSSSIILYHHHRSHRTIDRFVNHRSHYQSHHRHTITLPIAPSSFDRIIIAPSIMSSSSLYRIIMAPSLIDRFVSHRTNHQQ